MGYEVTGFEHLHRHSDFSLLDGFATVKEYAKRMKVINQQCLCITDHGVMGAVPQQIVESEKNNLYPVFGCELYVNAMQPKVESRKDSAEYFKTLDELDQKRFSKSSHLLALAYNEVGYSNLVSLTSWGWIHGFYRKPRVNHDVLEQYKEGIIFTSTCANSEIANALFRSGEDAAMEMLERYIRMFGDKFYLELMMLDFSLQKPYDAFLIKCHDKYHIPLILTQDCHYCLKEHSLNQRLMLMQQNKKTVAEVEADLAAGKAEEDLFELQDTNLWMKSEDEMNEKWERDYKEVIPYELFKQAKANTVKIAQFAKGVQIDRSLKLPSIPDAEQVLWDEIKRGFILRECPRNALYSSRVREEYDLICEKGYASYFLIQKEMIDEARRVGPSILGFGDGSEAVGPGRGSVCGSLVAYLLRLHDVEPIMHDLRFSRFLSPARGGKQMRIVHSLQPIQRCHHGE